MIELAMAMTMPCLCRRHNEGRSQTNGLEVVRQLLPQNSVEDFIRRAPALKAWRVSHRHRVTCRDCRPYSLFRRLCHRRWR